MKLHLRSSGGPLCGLTYAVTSPLTDDVSEVTCARCLYALRPRKANPVHWIGPSGAPICSRPHFNRLTDDRSKVTCKVCMSTVEFRSA